MRWHGVVGDVTSNMVMDVNDSVQMLVAFWQSGEKLTYLDGDMVVDINDTYVYQ